jgi:hypothetical protein
VTYFSYDDQSHPDMAPESYHGARRATGMEHHKPMADFSQYSANRRPGIFFSYHFGQMSLNLVRALKIVCDVTVTIHSLCYVCETLIATLYSAASHLFPGNRHKTLVNGSGISTAKMTAIVLL